MQRKQHHRETVFAERKLAAVSKHKEAERVREAAKDLRTHEGSSQPDILTGRRTIKSVDRFNPAYYANKGHILPPNALQEARRQAEEV